MGSPPGSAQDAMGGTRGGRRIPLRTMGTSAAGEIVDAVVELIEEAPASGEGVGHGFEIFGTRRGPARTGRVPRSGERVEIAASPGA